MAQQALRGGPWSGALAGAGYGGPLAGDINLPWGGVLGSGIDTETMMRQLQRATPEERMRAIVAQHAADAQAATGNVPLGMLAPAGMPSWGSLLPGGAPSEAQTPAEASALQARDAAVQQGMVGGPVAGAVAAGPVVGAIKAYHATYQPFDKFDWARLGEITHPNATGGEQEAFAMNLAQLGPWASEKDIAAQMAATHSLPVEIGGKGRAFASLDKLNEYISKAGGPEAARKKLIDAGYGHVAVEDEEFGGKSYVALSPEHFTVKR